MSRDRKDRVCPVEKAGALDSWVRRQIQNPNRILGPYVAAGMRVLDVGCGPGFFSLEMAKMVGPSGRVIAADLQDGMLQIVGKKIKARHFEKIVELHKCEKGNVGVDSQVDFILAFYVVHEIPDKEGFFKEMLQLLGQGKIMLIVEPKFHVSRKEFDEMAASLTQIGFNVSKGPKVFFSRTVVLKK